ncbi:Uncharacterised protein [Mycobacteroides abscessus subsp. abscessus]|nr:Uncharacterised protein [Mycobacteroides abscessus subsp. abscessus]
MKYTVTPAKEDADRLALLAVDGRTEVGVECVADGRVPRQLPAHAIPEGTQPIQWCTGGQDERRPSSVEVGERTDMVGHHRTAVTAFLPVRTKHEVLHDELRPFVEQVKQCHAAIRAFEGIVRAHFDHRHAASCRADGVLHSGERLLLLQQNTPGVVPGSAVDDGGPVGFAARHRRTSSVRSLPRCNRASSDACILRPPFTVMSTIQHHRTSHCSHLGRLPGSLPPNRRATYRGRRPDHSTVTCPPSTCHRVSMRTFSSIRRSWVTSSSAPSNDSSAASSCSIAGRSRWLVGSSSTSTLTPRA